jgi:hypothetical protein
MVMTSDNNTATTTLKVIKWTSPLPGNLIPFFANHSNS